MKKQFSLVLICVLVVSFFGSTTGICAPPLSQVDSIKFINNNHIAKKVLVVLAYGNVQFVKDLFAVIKEINEK